MGLRLVEDGPEVPPAAPEHLTPVGQSWWLGRVEELRAAGILEQVDLALVEQAAEMYEGRRQAQEAVAKHGQIVQGRKGVKKNPAVSKHLEYAREFRQVMKQLDRQIGNAVPRSDDDDSAFTFG